MGLVERYAAAVKRNYSCDTQAQAEAVPQSAQHLGEVLDKRRLPSARGSADGYHQRTHESYGCTSRASAAVPVSFPLPEPFCRSTLLHIRRGPRNSH